MLVANTPSPSSGKNRSPITVQHNTPKLNIPLDCPGTLWKVQDGTDGGRPVYLPVATLLLTSRE